MSGQYSEAVREVSVVVSEPWSFVDEQGSNIFMATVRATDGETLLLLLSGQHYVAAPRGSEGFSLIPVTDEPSREAPRGAATGGEASLPHSWRIFATCRHTGRRRGGAFASASLRRVWVSAQRPDVCR
jgi:hypothetical protein